MILTVNSMLYMHTQVKKSGTINDVYKGIVIGYALAKAKRLSRNLLISESNFPWNT